MGFGYLFVGYLFTFNFISYSAYTDVFAFLLMLIGLSTLSRYARGFRIGFFAGLPLALLSLVMFGERILFLLGFVSYSSLFVSVTAVWAWIFKAVFLWFVLGGVAEIAAETELPLLRLKALRNRAFFLLPAALGILLETNLFKNVGILVWMFTVLYMLSGLCFTFLNAKLFYECYAFICLEGDENMERKPSRFAIVNRFHAFSDRMDEKTLERKRQAAARRKERRENKRNSKNGE